jgi:hypothetical protein
MRVSTSQGFHQGHTQQHVTVATKAKTSLPTVHKKKKKKKKVTEPEQALL